MVLDTFGLEILSGVVMPLFVPATTTDCRRDVESVASEDLVQLADMLLAELVVFGASLLDVRVQLVEPCFAIPDKIGKVHFVDNLCGHDAPIDVCVGIVVYHGKSIRPTLLVTMQKD
jgi:hypothetical protein